MSIPLLLPPVAGRRVRRLLGFAAGLGLLGTASAQAQTVFGLNRAGSLLITTSVADIQANAAPTSTQAITNVDGGTQLVGFDSRPATGELFALGYNGAGTARLYTINRTTGVATPVAAVFPLALGTGFEGIGLDFNPTVDRIRVTSNNGGNFRLHPVTGGVAATDSPLNFPAGSTFVGQQPLVGSVAYTNSFIGAASTTLYDIDESRSTMFVQDLPNAGTLITPVTVASGAALLATGDQTDFDIHTNPSTRAVTTLLARTRGGLTNIYSLTLSGAGAGSATLLRTSTAGPSIDDIAIVIDRAAPAASGALLYAVSSNNTLVSFNADQPGFILAAVPITGITANQTLVGTDFRPNTGQLFGLGYNGTTGESRLYIINLTNGVATPVGAGPITLGLGSGATALNAVGFDFNPTVDRIRVTGLNGANLRLNPNNGALAGTDTNLNFVSGATGVPTIGALAYTNSFAGSTGTRLIDIDDVRNQLFEQGSPTVSPNTGQLTSLSGTNLLPSSGAINDLDFFYDAASQLNRGFVVSNADATATTATFSTLYTLDLAAGTTAAVGTIGGGIPVRDVSAFIAPLTQPAFTGRLFYGIAGGSLISFVSDNPGNIRSAVNITGLGAGQVLAGSDFRPFNGLLYALGYDATNSLGQLYTLNLTTGALSAVGGLNSLPLGPASGIGVDFNPVPDRFRVVGSNGSNFRLNPNTGALVTPADGATGRALSATAYTNNDNNTATGATQYGYDQATNELVMFSNPNAGTNATVGASGITVNTANGVEFDIFSDLTNPATPANSAFAAAAPGTTTADFLYSVNLGNGAFTSLGRIGNGSNVGGLAAFLTPGPVTLAGPTWTGAVDTNYGTAGNWSTNTVPSTLDDVNIPDTNNDPVVNGPQGANAVALGSGATLTLADNGVLNVAGTFTNTLGTVTFSGVGSGRVDLVGGAAQTINGTAVTFPNLTSNAVGTTLETAVSIRRGLRVTGPLTTTNQVLTLLSSAAGTAFIFSSGGLITGNVTVQRFIDPNGTSPLPGNSGVGYRHYSSPVANSTVNDLSAPGFTPVVNPLYNSVGNTVTPFPTVYGYDETRVNTSGSAGAQDFDKGFFSPNALTDALEVTRGYAVNIPASALVDFVGTATDGAVTATNLTRGTQTESGYHLRGNPYPSALDWNLMVSNGRLSNVENALYVFKSSGQYTGAYASYVNNAGTNGGTNVVPLGQGFFVRTATPGTGSLAFTNAERITTFSATPFQRSTTDTRPQLTLALRGTAAAMQAMVYTEQGASASFDRAFDAHYLPGSNGLTLATEVGALALAVNGLPVFTGADVTVPLRVAAATTGTYVLGVDNLANLPAGYFAYLLDGLTGTYTNLARTPSVSVNLTAGAAAGGRYAVVFSTQARVLATAPAALARLASVYPNPARGLATLLLPVALRGAQAVAVTVVDNVGRVVLSRTLAAGAAETLELPLATLAPGVYSVVARTAAGVVAKRLVVE